MNPIKGRSFFCSWSGGKDSCLALHRAVQSGGRPRLLFTMMEEGGEISRSHALPRTVLQEQSRLLGIPIAFGSANWDQYEDAFLEALRDFKTKGIETGVFGDIDVEEHREWVHGVCSQTGIIPFHPLWQNPRQKLLKEFISLGFQAKVAVLRNDQLDHRLIGRTIDQQLISEMEAAGIDVSGESGEYHTVVTDGPIFSARLRLTTERWNTLGDYSFLQTRLKE